MEKIKVYSSAWCRDCALAKDLLKEKGIEYEDFDIADHPELVDRIVEARGKRVTPTLEYNGKFIDGNHFSREKFEKDLEELLA